MQSPIVSFTLILACLLVGEGFGACPGLNEPCMNEQNHQKCQKLLDDGCTNLIWMESCPLQFACGSYKDNSRGNLRKQSSSSSDTKPRSQPKPQPPPDSCVTLSVYDNEKCSGEPRRTLSFPTWSQPGSACYHDVSMPHYSVKDQYCNAYTGNWHETIFMGSDDCSTKWWSHNDGIDLTFTSDSCIGGYRLVECHAGPCHQEDADKTMTNSAMPLNIEADDLPLTLLRPREAI